jgi:hypothetical protein
MRRKRKAVKNPKVYNATELKDLVALNELKGFNDEELTRAMAQAAGVEGYAIGLIENYPTDQTIVNIGMNTAWHARVFREVVAVEMWTRSQADKGESDKPGQYL